MLDNLIKERYCIKGETSWEDICKRVSDFIATTKEENEKFYEMMMSKDFLPNSPTLMNAGTDTSMLSACFYLPISDCISNGRDGIFDQVRNAALIFKFGGGVGLNFSNLRPAGSKVKSTNGVSSGVISFMKNFNTMTETIKQGGKRRGALMGCLDITHPEIDDFIACKTIEGDLSNFNISVKLTDEFMTSETNGKLMDAIIDGIYKNGEPGILFSDTIERFNPTPELGTLNVNPCVTGDTIILTKKYGNIPISNCINEDIEIWNGFEWSSATPKITGYDQKILKITIKNNIGEKKIIKCTPYHTFILREEYSFMTEIRKLASELKIGDSIYPFNDVSNNQTYGMIVDNMISKIEEYGTSDIVYCLNEPKNHSFVANGVLIGNCAEALLLDFESCNLGSINWSNIIKEDIVSDNWKDKVDWIKYEDLIRNSIKFLDHVIDKNKYPLPEIDTASKLTRKIGLGGMGLHDALIKLGIPYDSPLSREIGKEMELFMKRIAKDESDKNNFGNKSLTTIAPTGTISIIAEVSSGIEPVFNWVVTRKDSLGEHYMLHPLFEKALDNLDWKIVNTLMTDEERLTLWGTDLKKYVIEHCHKMGTIQDISWLPEEFRALFKNAMDINWKDHIKMQAIFQNNGVDMSISKTINLPNNATKDNIREAIQMAWKLGCKGLTIYRSGSRENEVLNLKQKEVIVDLTKKLDAGIDEYKERLTYKRPRNLVGFTYKVQSGCGKLFVTINEHNGKPYEVFIQSGGSGGCEAGNQALGRTISLALRNGGDIRNIIKQLCKVKCPAALRNVRSEGKSCSDIVGKLMQEYMPDEDIDEIPPPISTYEVCPDCKKKTLIREAGCKVCHSCGYSKCG
jgi:ribonucleotide reductase alpha subunit